MRASYAPPTPAPRGAGGVSSPRSPAQLADGRGVPELLDELFNLGAAQPLVHHYVLPDGLLAMTAAQLRREGPHHARLKRGRSTMTGPFGHSEGRLVDPGAPGARMRATGGPSDAGQARSRLQEGEGGPCLFGRFLPGAARFLRMFPIETDLSPKEPNAMRVIAPSSPRSATEKFPVSCGAGLPSAYASQEPGAKAPLHRPSSGRRKVDGGAPPMPSGVRSANRRGNPRAPLRASAPGGGNSR